jgi:hypothetical protein
VGAVVLAEGRQIEIEHLPEAVRRALDQSAAARGGGDAARREEIIALLHAYQGNISAAVGRPFGACFTRRIGDGAGDQRTRMLALSLQGLRTFDWVRATWTSTILWTGRPSRRVFEMKR